MRWRWRWDMRWHAMDLLAILDDLPIKINVFSHICILRNDLNWTEAVIWHTYYNHSNANHQCNQQK